MEFTSEIVIDRPIAEVEARLTDPDHPLHWQTELQRIERVSGTPGTVGGVSKLYYQAAGRDFELKETVFSAATDGQVATYETKGLHHTITVRLVAVDAERTRAVLENDMKLSGMAKLAAPMLGATLRTQAESKVVAFKSWIETGADA